MIIIDFVFPFHFCELICDHFIFFINSLRSIESVSDVLLYLRDKKSLFIIFEYRKYC